MDIPIDDGDAVKAMEFLGIPGGDGDRVEQTEAHGSPGAGMVSGGADGAKGIPGLACEDSIDCGENASGGVKRDLPGFRRNADIAAGKFVRTFLDFHKGGFDIIGIMAKCDLGDLGPATPEDLGAGESGEGLANHCHAARGLRMPGSGAVPLIKFIENQCRGEHDMPIVSREKLNCQISGRMVSDSEMNQKISWGILGTGSIAKTFATELPHSQTGTLVAVGSRSQESADRFAGQFPGIRAHASYAALLADPEVQAVYLATPHPEHPEWAIAAAEAGKHILCEKPLALNAADAMVVIEAARRHGVTLMEAFMYRCHPRTACIAELVRSGKIGRVRLIRAHFSFAAKVNLESRIFSNTLGGGGILDIGCYAVSVARLVAGAAVGKPYLDPESVSGEGVLCETGVDEMASATLKFPEGILAQVSCGVTLRKPADLEICGEKGILTVPDFWNPPGAIHLHLFENDRKEVIETDPNSHKYALEADVFSRAISDPKELVVSGADTLGNMRTLDRWRAAVGVTYEAERDEAPERRRPLSQRALQPGRWAEIPTSRIPGLDKPVSRLVLGIDNQDNLAQLAAMADDFVERGGTAFDTAHIYGGGRMESVLGQWLKNRGLREAVVLTLKGAHTPYCTPQDLRQQFDESLERLQTDHADIYMLHRDNPDVPVGEFVDVLDELRAAGRIRLVGGSNWSLDRLTEANAYAAKNGREPFRIVSNNLSLARMVDPIWPGCVSAKGTAWREWFLHHEAALFAWSSQARGYFAPNRLSGTVTDTELLRCWDAEDNRERCRRATEFAAERGVSPLNVALAYVLSQPFPTFALIGPRTLDETRTALAGLDLHLTSGEMAWLDLETPERT
mgnify:CR=1 FL=1